MTRLFFHLVHIMNEISSCDDCLGQLCRAWILYKKSEVTAGHFTFLCLVFFAASGCLQDAHPDDGGDAAQLLAQAGIHGTGGVQHGVGHVLFALVHHVFNVQARLGG